eukprot:6213505-Pleurochrysis_carterae.AAC.2
MCASSDQIQPTIMACATLTDEQSRVVREWKNSKSITLNAVCGSGKTHTLLQCAVVHKNSILVSYNTNAARQLQERINDAYAMHSASCYTYHALFSKLVQPCVDDDDVCEALALLETREHVADEVRACGALLVDEAQDIKPLYVEMLRRCGLLDGSRPVLLVGDPEQLIYDYDLLNTADDAYLLDPERTIWDPAQEETRYTKFLHMVLTRTFRIPPILADFVNHVTFPHVPLVSQGCGSDENLHVCTVNLYKCASIVASFLRRWGPGTVILTPTRNFNFALAGIVNYLSVVGFSFHVQGLDASNTAVSEAPSMNTTRVMTWHASKGLEFESVIVFGVSSSSRRKPLHVALTRASKNLLIINDEKKPSLHVLHGAQYVSTRSSVSTDSATTRMLALNSTREKAGQASIPAWQEMAVSSPRTEGIVSFERRLASCRWTELKHLVSIEESSIHTMSGVASPLSCNDGRSWVDNDFVVSFAECVDDVRDIYIMAAAFFLEFKDTGKIKLIEHLFEPASWIKEAEKMQIIRAGGKDRWDLVKLQHKNKQTMMNAYNELRGTAASISQEFFVKRIGELCCTLAVVANGSLRHYQHRAGHLLPINVWIRIEILQALINLVCASMLTAAPFVYDKRLFYTTNGDSLMLVTRCPYYSPSEKTAAYLILDDECTNKSIAQLASPVLACNGVQRVLVINPVQNKRFTLTSAASE